MITVHHLNNSRSQRILWLLEELGLEYEVKRYQRNPQTMLAPPELRAVHPLGKSPVITRETLVLAESGAIVETPRRPLRRGQARAGARLAGARALSLLAAFRRRHGAAAARCSSCCSIASSPSRRCLCGRSRAPSPTGRSAPIVLPNIERNLDFMESELGKNEWFAGAQFSAADIQMSFPVEAYRARGGLDEKRPRLMRFLEKIHSRPAYRRAVERGGEYALMR